MATRERRLADFDSAGDPPQGRSMELLCEDNTGTYQIPFACAFVDGKWTNAKTGEPIGAQVVGWREPRRR
jgi:hypothetical protein